jgi:exodeoxyribonuclease VII small subunit
MAGNSFEASIKRLEEIVRELERGDAPLEKSLSLFEEGAGLAAACEKLLGEAEQKVTSLLRGTDGKPEEAEFGIAE